MAKGEHSEETGCGELRGREPLTHCTVEQIST